MKMDMDIAFSYIKNYSTPFSLLYMSISYIFLSLHPSLSISPSVSYLNSSLSTPLSALSSTSRNIRVYLSFSFLTHVQCILFRLFHTQSSRLFLQIIFLLCCCLKAIFGLAVHNGRVDKGLVTLSNHHQGLVGM
jgi:hypothetical protein